MQGRYVKANTRSGQAIVRDAKSKQCKMHKIIDYNLMFFRRYHSDAEENLLFSFEVQTKVYDFEENFKVLVVKDYPLTPRFLPP